MFKRQAKKKPLELPNQFRVKKGDTVMIITGKDKGKTGIIKHVLRHRGKVVVEGLNMMTKAVRPNPMYGQAGGLIQMEAPIHISNVMVMDTKNNKPTRVKMQQVDGRNVRVAKKSGEQLDV